MLYIIPGILAGITFYLILALLNWCLNKVLPKHLQLRAHSRLVIHCLVAVAYTIFLVFFGGGGNWATHLQISGFLLSGCMLSLVTPTRDTPPQQEENGQMPSR